MSRSSWLFERMRGWTGREALAGDWGSVRYEELLDDMANWSASLDDAGVTAGRVIAFNGDCGERTVALFLALIARGCIAVPLASATDTERAMFLEIATAEFQVEVRRIGTGSTICRATGPRHPLIEELAEKACPGLVLFSSGSTGRAKAMLHDFDRLLERYQVSRTGYRALSFLLLDHIGGINTIFYALANGGTVITVGDRRPETVCQAIERHRVELLPTTPTFLNLLLLSGAQDRYDLASLRLVTYGTEVMPASTLARARAAFPQARFHQTYGLSELGILRCKSRDDGSLWVKVGGDGYETKVVGGILWIRARSALLGYLNAPSPFREDGWFDTGDRVEVDGDYVRFLGRASDLINVGGSKVYPAEVESVLAEMSNIAEVAIYGEPNALVGQIVCARIRPIEPEDPKELLKRIQRHCQGRLEVYKIPRMLKLSEQSLATSRFKTQRPSS
jgi:acyl-CoA synthetase (AMP-forming)/AMP-acid ligase II